MKYSGRKIVIAGEFLVDHRISLKTETSDFSTAMDILSWWRFSHENSLEKAFICLQKAALKKDRSAIFAKRLKRYDSIIQKLHRLEKMKLNRMQDIGGCRAILENPKKLYQTLRELKQRPEFRNKHGSFKIKDYIKEPKSDGYRGFHIIGTFPNSTKENKKIEIQLRTRMQHYWATAVEIVDLFTEQSLKSNEGTQDWARFFLHVSQQLSVMESIHLFSKLSEDVQFEEYKKIVDSDHSLLLSCEHVQKELDSLNIFSKFTAFAGSLNVVDKELGDVADSAGYILLQIDLKNKNVSSTIFSSESSESASQEFINAEKEYNQDNQIIIALVSTTAVGDIREAYPNYFADSSNFIKYLNYIYKIQTHRKSTINRKLFIR